MVWRDDDWMVRWSEAVGWSAAIAATAAMLLFGAAWHGAASVVLLAAGWCIRIDREEYAVQVVWPDDIELNR